METRAINFSRALSVLPPSPGGLNVNSPRCNRGKAGQKAHDPAGVELCLAGDPFQPHPGLMLSWAGDPRVHSCLANPGLFTFKPSGLGEAEVPA
jgi:hypothetical protein